MTVHKSNTRTTPPLLSIVLLDWSCRESLHTLDWLSCQAVPRDQYELIWIELYDRVLPEAMSKADVVITCNQSGLPNKHAAYNIGLLQSRGLVVTICDSDAVFPSDFVSSVLEAFRVGTSSDCRSMVLMHYEWRSPQTYPRDLIGTAQLTRYTWWDLWPNVGACMSVRKQDAIRFGGFDEHRSFRGHRAGPYDLGWRLINAGLPEIWHDQKVALWHFSHDNSDKADELWGRNRTVYPHVKGHVLTAVEAFSTGRILPLHENDRIRELRLSQRQIGTSFEEKYARYVGPGGFTRWQILAMRLKLTGEQLQRVFWSLMRVILNPLRKLLGDDRYRAVKARWKTRRSRKSAE